MSSSGEEVEVEIDEHETWNTWNNERITQLVTAIVGQVTGPSRLLPFYEVEIDWELVSEAVGCPKEKCQRKWQLLLDSIRQFRTMTDVALDILQHVSRPEISKANKRLKTVNGVTNAGAAGKNTPREAHVNAGSSAKSTPMKKLKRKVNPDHPPRPKASGYTVFCTSNLKSFSEKYGLKGVPLMLKMGSLWKQMSESEKKSYNAESVKQKQEYLSKVEAYAKEHPDDSEIQAILEEELAKSKSTKHKKKTGSSSHPKNTDSESSVQPDTNDYTLDSLNDTSESLLSSTPQSAKKRHTDESELSQDSSPSKKKKKKLKFVTGEKVYIETKFDDYKESHEDLDEDEVREKLARKYKKMSHDKRAKYETIAEERNG